MQSEKDGMPAIDFGNGTILSAEELSKLTQDWQLGISAWVHVANDEEMVKGVPDAENVMVIAAMGLVNAIEMSGGVPTLSYLLVDPDGGLLHLGDPGTPHLPQDQWGPLSRYVFSKMLLKSCTDRNARYVVRIGTRPGRLAHGGPEDKGKRVRMAPGENPQLLLTLTVFDLATTNIVRWWTRVVASGDSEHPLTVVPWTQEHDEPFDWHALWRKLLDQDDNPHGLMSDVLPPGIEDLTGCEQNILDEVPPTIEHSEAIIEAANGGPTVIIGHAMETMADLGLKPEQLRDLLRTIGNLLSSEHHTKMKGMQA
jgi:hypothetical protein